MKPTTLVAPILLQVGLLAAPFFKDVVGRVLVFLLIGGGVAILVIPMILGALLVALRGE